MASHAAAHILQTSGWGAFKGRFGWECDRVAVWDTAGAFQAGSLLLLRRLLDVKAAALTMAYAPKGPLVNWDDADQVQRVLAEMARVSRIHGASVLKIEPDLPDTSAHRARLWRHGLRPSAQTIQPRSTILLDISGDDDQILQAMKSKWRYNIRLAGRKEVTVRQGTRDDMAEFNRLMQITGQRDGFYVHSADYFNAAFDLFVPHDAAFLFAEYAGQVLASIAVFVTGQTAWYLWGASSNEERNRMPNHALQWAAIRWAKSRGATRYDLWGIPDDVGKVVAGLAPHSPNGLPASDLPFDLQQSPQNELWGVYRLKQGFGGNVVRYVGAWDMPLDSMGHRLYSLGLTAREKLADVKEHLRNSPVVTSTNGASPAGAIAEPVQKAPAPSPATPQPVTNVEQWRTILAALPEPHVLQSWEWGEVKAQTGWRAERYVLQHVDGQPRAAFQLLWRQPIPLAPIQMAYLPKGPLLDWDDAAVVTDVLDAIERVARARKFLFVKIDPNVDEESEAGGRLLTDLRRRGWFYSQDQIQFKNTGYTALGPLDTNSAEELLAAMKSKWRYNVRLAGKRGVFVRAAGVDALPAFYELYAETGQRDGFLIRPYAYYKAVWETFLQAQQEAENPAGGALLLAEHPDETQPLAGLFLMRYADTTWYFYGASSERRRRDMPNYLLQWEAMCWARANGCTRYDWWGAPTHVDDTDDSMQGVWQFKQGFGAELQTHIGAWDYAPFPLLYRTYTQAAPRLMQLIRKVGKGA
ncbi:MAG: peptidoglycan bridge formation glycyltransferase FemA/FemB family protein [Caldilineaceae bacterium]|nr:peptidoglycan bridge formation glycyltransferase FemA/FemB family protein [Caldilineaceae bacterium]